MSKHYSQDDCDWLNSYVDLLMESHAKCGSTVNSLIANGEWAVTMRQYLLCWQYRLRNKDKLPREHCFQFIV